MNLQKGCLEKIKHWSDEMGAWSAQGQKTRRKTARRLGTMSSGPVLRQRQCQIHIEIVAVIYHWSRNRAAFPNGPNDLKQNNYLCSIPSYKPFKVQTVNIQTQGPSGYKFRKLMERFPAAVCPLYSCAAARPASSSMKEGARSIEDLEFASSTRSFRPLP